MIRNYTIVALALLVIGCMTYARYMNNQLTASRANARAIALRASNEVALHDTTHENMNVGWRIGYALGTTARAFTKLVVQEDDSADAVDSALGSHHAAKQALDIVVQKLDTTIVSAAGRDSAQGAREQFHLRQQPYTVDAVVSRRARGDSSSLAVAIILDTMQLGVRIQCGAGEDGIHSASVLATSPAWATVRIGSVQQNPDVCNPPPAQATQSPRRFVNWAPVALSVGRQLGSGSNGWTAQIGTALTFGPP